VATPRSRRAWRWWAQVLLAFGLVVVAAAPRAAAAGPAPGPAPDAPRSHCLLEKGDRVAFIGSSSTRIGVWPRTVEFLLRTRHPGLVTEFSRFSTGGGTLETGLEHIDGWLDLARPTVVILNYGGNDAAAGADGLPAFQQRLLACVAKIETHGARVILVTPQGADIRKSGLFAAAHRTLYAETMLGFGRERGWPVIDVHHPLEMMQQSNQRTNPSFTILRDPLHLTGPAYVGWGFLFYDRLDLPLARSALTLKATGAVVSHENCTVRDVETGPGLLAFTRTDAVLPILPPVPLPPRFSVPLEAHSRYLLQVKGLETGRYEILCEQQPIGVVSAVVLEAGVNLNTLLLNDHREPPWHAMSHALWEGRDLQRIGSTPWRFVVRKLAEPPPDTKPAGP
jgi:hypothetical protein